MTKPREPITVEWLHEIKPAEWQCQTRGISYANWTIHSIRQRPLNEPPPWSGYNDGPFVWSFVPSHDQNMVPLAGHPRGVTVLVMESRADVLTLLRILLRKDAEQPPAHPAMTEERRNFIWRNYQYTENTHPTQPWYEAAVGELLREVDRLKGELAALRQRLLTAAGDDLCRLTQEEIKELTSGAVQIPPLEEFLASCERFHAQVASEAGVNNSCHQGPHRSGAARAVEVSQSRRNDADRHAWL